MRIPNEVHKPPIVAVALALLALLMSAAQPAIGDRGGPFLTIDKSHSGDFTIGEQGTYTVGVANVGDAPTYDADTIIVKDSLPAELAYVLATGDGWDCDNDDGDPQDVWCTHPGPVDPGASLPDITLTVDVLGPAGVVANVAFVKTSLSFTWYDNDSDPTTILDPLEGDLVTVSITGGIGYANGGPLATGDVSVTPSTGTVSAVRGGGTLVDGTTVRFDVSQLWILPVYFGSVGVTDAGAGIDLWTPVFFAAVYRAAGTNAATSSSSWIDFSSFPWRNYRLTWTVDDIG